MNDTESETRPRRSLGVILLDGMMRLAFGPAPTPKIIENGEPSRRRAGRYLLAAGALVAVAATALVVVVLVHTGDDQAPGPGPAAALPGLASGPPTTSTAIAPAITVSGSPSASTTATTPAATASATKPTPTVSGTPASGSSPAGNATGGGGVPLTASYATTAVGLLGYQVTVTVANPGPAARDGWKLTMTFPRSTLEVGNVTGATATQDGAVWTFTPDTTTARVAASGSVRVVFSVYGATLIDAAPKDCRIDGNSCSAA